MKRILALAVLVIATATTALGQTPGKPTTPANPATPATPATPTSPAAQEKPTGESVAASTTVEQELIKLDKDWAEIGRRGDIPALERIYADEYVGVNAQGKVSTRAETLAAAKAGVNNPNQPSSVNYDNYKAQIYGDTAVLTHDATTSGTENGQPFTNKVRVVHVFVKRQGRWQAVFTQTTPVPQQPKP